MLNIATEKSREERKEINSTYTCELFSRNQLED